MTPPHEMPGRWDVFLAHAGPDTATAVELRRRLVEKGHRCFLDAECLVPGDPWDEELPKAQRASTVTVVMVSDRTEAAWYEREEIASAIALAREDGHQHRVVPIFVHLQEAPPSVPYGLRRLHGLSMTSNDDLDTIAEQISALLRR